MAAHKNDITALVTLSERGLFLARILSSEMGGKVFAHKDTGSEQAVELFDGIIDLTAELFKRFKNIVYIAPAGVAVRAIAPYLKHKSFDPAVVAVDIGGRWAISLLSGHEGGANLLAFKISNLLGCEPVVTTSTQAEKDIIAGLGCRKGAAAEDIVYALNYALEKAACSLCRVRLLASADIKKGEAGLIMAAEKLGIPLYFLSSEKIRNMPLRLSVSDFVQEQTGLPGVAEPCALIAGQNTKLILGKTICKSVTVALARENFLWSE